MFLIGEPLRSANMPSLQDSEMSWGGHLYYTYPVPTELSKEVFGLTTAFTRALVLACVVQCPLYSVC